jgi:hypothetical protein
VWEQLDNGRVVHRFESVVLAATLAVIPVLVIESDVKSSGWQTFAYAANWLIWSVFLAELVFVLIVAPRKKAALRAHWLDVGIVLVTAPAFGRFLASLRLVRLVRHEANEDFHLVLESGAGHMIAESPSSACSRGATPFRRRHMREARMKLRLCSPARVVGVAFFDFKHGQTGVAPNAIELHPILDFACLSG